MGYHTPWFATDSFASLSTHEPVVNLYLNIFQRPAALMVKLEILLSGTNGLWNSVIWSLNFLFPFSLELERKWYDWIPEYQRLMLTECLSWSGKRVEWELHCKEWRENISRSMLYMEILFIVYLRRIPLGPTATYSYIVRIVRDNQCNKHGFTNILCGTCPLYWRTKVRTRPIVN